jgi:hypothetical protein
VNTKIGKINMVKNEKHCVSYTADLLSSITNDQEMAHYMRNLTVEYL